MSNCKANIVNYMLKLGNQLQMMQLAINYNDKELKQALSQQFNVAQNGISQLKVELTTNKKENAVSNVQLKLEIEEIKKQNSTHYAQLISEIEEIKKQNFTHYAQLKSDIEEIRKENSTLSIQLITAKNTIANLLQKLQQTENNLSEHNQVQDGMQSSILALYNQSISDKYQNAINKVTKTCKENEVPSINAIRLLNDGLIKQLSMLSANHLDQTNLQCEPVNTILASRRLLLSAMKEWRLCSNKETKENSNYEHLNIIESCLSNYKARLLNSMNSADILKLISKAKDDFFREKSQNIIKYYSSKIHNVVEAYNGYSNYNVAVSLGNKLISKIKELDFKNNPNVDFISSDQLFSLEKMEPPVLYYWLDNEIYTYNSKTKCKSHFTIDSLHIGADAEGISICNKGFLFIEMSNLFEIIASKEIIESREPKIIAKKYTGLCGNLGKIYCIGGWNIQHLCNCEVYDISTNKWRALSPLSVARSHAICFCFNRKQIYALAGNREYDIYRDIEVLDISTSNQTWINKSVQINQEISLSAMLAMQISDNEVLLFGKDIYIRESIKPYVISIGEQIAVEQHRSTIQNGFGFSNTTCALFDGKCAYAVDRENAIHIYDTESNKWSMIPNY